MAAAAAKKRAPRTFVVGVGLTPFRHPSKDKRDYPDMAKEAIEAALKDAGLKYSDVETAVVGYCYGDPTCGQRAVYEVGLTGIPVLNVNNNCSTGSTALFTARKLVQGVEDCVLALGMEKMERNLSQVHKDRGWTAPTDKHWDEMYEFAEDGKHDWAGVKREKVNPRFNEFTDNVIKLYAYAAREHCEKYGTTPKQLAKVAYKNHAHSIHNPYASMQKKFSLPIIEGAPTLLEPLTALQACATGNGAAAAIVCSEEFVQKHNLWGTAVEIVAQSMVTDMASSFKAKSFITLSGFDMAREAAKQVYEAAGKRPSDVDVLEVHDCFSCNELMMYEALGLCGLGKGGALIDAGEWMATPSKGSLCKLGGRWVVNPSGGLLSKGHPIGATGLAQCAELCWQLRGMSDKRQVPGAKVALQHNFGIGGAAVVTMYEKAMPAARL